MKRKFSFPVFAIIMILALSLSCARKSTSPNAEMYTPSEPLIGIDPATHNYMPKATVFKMSGDYADHVAVSFDQNGRLTYFPAPSDITERSMPVEIADGWWLNRQGFGPNSQFLTYTLREYAALKTAPSPEEIKAALIPGACVTDFRTLPIPLSEALQLSAGELKRLVIKD